MKMLKFLVTFIAATILGALGSKLFGMFGAVLGSLAGSIVGWWVAVKFEREYL
jgi:uncharacterized membrane protein YdjX (TVP38/TMEM64 family)